MVRKTNYKKSVKRIQKGGRVSMPSEFFGKNSGQYLSSKIIPASKIGAGNARNGMEVLSNKYGVNNMQTGGKRKMRKTKRNRKGGAIIGTLVKEAYKLAAPALLLAVKELARKSKKQSGGKKKKSSKTKKKRKNRK
jgi:hypothetical protein